MALPTYSFFFTRPKVRNETQVSTTMSEQTSLYAFCGTLQPLSLAGTAPERDDGCEVN